MERLKKIKDTLLCEIESQLCGNLALVDTKELGEVVDMVKDLSETMYYCSVVEAMERPYYSDYPRYYTEHRAMEVSHHNGKEGYDEHKDMKEGKSPLKRKEYLEAKEAHKDKEKLMHELEEYLHELSADLTEMLDGALPEEKALAQQKISAIIATMK